MDDLAELMEQTIKLRALAQPDSPVLLMVSGGSDSTAMAYCASDLHKAGKIGPLHVLHVNHRLRGEAADADERFVVQLARILDIPCDCVAIDVGQIATAEHGNVEAVARRERYAAAHDVLSEMCMHLGVPVNEGRIFVAHTADDRVENFYMRSIVGTGPGGFRSMLYQNGNVVRPLLDAAREDLRRSITARRDAGLPVATDEAGALWQEDATNEHTDRFRAFVRHEIVPLAKERNPRLLETLTRSMNLIADEDDLLDGMAARLSDERITWLAEGQGCVIAPQLATDPLPLRRRVAASVLLMLLGDDERIETASVEAILSGYDDKGPIGGYVANIQGNLAVSANKNGVRVEPMAAFRMRRKRM